MIGPLGARLTPFLNRQVAIGSIIATILICTVTWPVYDNGFWNQRGLGTMGFWEYQEEAKLEELDAMRGQPLDTLILREKGNVWDEWGESCLSYEESSESEVWNHIHEGVPEDWCLLPAVHWIDWGIYQPTRPQLIDFTGVNEHANLESSRNAAGTDVNYFGSTQITEERTFFVEDLGADRVPTDVGCNFRTSVRGAGTHMQQISLTDSAGQTLWQNDGISCDSVTLYVNSGESYTLSYTTISEGVNDSVNMISDFSAVSLFSKIAISNTCLLYTSPSPRDS